MQITLLRNLVQEMAGEGSGQIVDILFDKRDINEFLIAKKMNLTINQVRNILYKLSAEGLVSFTRKKDKRKGWYIYFWTLNTEKCLMKLEVELTKKLEELKQAQKQREYGRYYTCKNCNIEVTEEKALEDDFSCSECAEVYTLVDNTNNLKELKGKITKRENELNEIKQELESVRVKTKKVTDAAQKKLAAKKSKGKKAKGKSSKAKKVTKPKKTKQKK
ncbi:Transcription factor E [uncultured archaeon]|nr:Transcription factor E [uncultured archaeon]